MFLQKPQQSEICFDTRAGSEVSFTIRYETFASFSLFL